MSFQTLRGPSAGGPRISAASRTPHSSLCAQVWAAPELRAIPEVLGLSHKQSDYKLGLGPDRPGVKFLSWAPALFPLSIFPSGSLPHLLQGLAWRQWSYQITPYEAITYSHHESPDSFLDLFFSIELITWPTIYTSYLFVIICFPTPHSNVAFAFLSVLFPAIISVPRRVTGI